jgi:hypothetical protein
MQRIAKSDSVRRPPAAARPFTFALIAFLSAICCPSVNLVAEITGAPDLTEIQPLLPPGISDFNLEVFGKLAYTWSLPDKTQVVEIIGNFSARMGPYKVASRDAVLWFTHRKWQDRPYLDVDVFLWQEAEVFQAAGTVERGPVLIVTLRTFGKLLLSADGHAPRVDDQGDLFREATKVRRLLTIAPPEEAEKAGAPVQVAPTVERLALARPKTVKQVDFSAENITSRVVDDQAMVIAIGDVMVSQGSPSKSAEYVELHADSAVLYANKDMIGGKLPALLGGAERKGRKTKGDLQVPAAEPSAAAEPKLRGRDQDDREAMKEWVRAVYLEGDVVLTRGQRMIRANRLYYDFEEEKALILDPVMRALDAAGKVPIYVRAERVRQTAANQYSAEKAQFTTSEFHTPHGSVAAATLDLTDRTPRNEAGEAIGIQAGTYQATHTTLNLEGLPIAYWPVSKGDFSADRQAFRSATIGYTEHFGFTAEARWSLFNLMGLEPPKGYDATLKTNYFSERGPGFGIDMDYQADNYFGLVRSDYIHDDGKDELGPVRSSYPPQENRGRALWRHRQYLPLGMELTLEASYLSDLNYLEEYNRREFENGKDQETLVYLLKRQDNKQGSILLNYRINPFQTQTEHLPDAVFSVIGQPLGDFLTYYTESRAGVVRYRYDDNSQYGLPLENTFAYGSTGSVLRADTRQEFRLPAPELGPLKLTPFVMGRATEYDDGPNHVPYYRSINQANVVDPDYYKPPRSRYHHSGNLGRYFASYGLTGNMMLSKVDGGVESRMLDLHRLRHIIEPDFTVWNAHSNRDPLKLTPFDNGVEDIDDAGGGTVGMKQRFETKRGGPGNWRTVDWITLDVRAGFFSHKQNGQNTHGDYVYSRPEESITSNFIATNFQYRISDSTVLVYDNVYDANAGNLGTSDLSLAVERIPRLAYFAGWRYIHDTSSNLLAGGANYKLSEKHTVGIREVYDIDAGRNYTTQVVYVRKWPRWYTAISFDVDKSLDETSVNLSVWPEGTPKLGLGSRRYTGLADTVGSQTQ